MAAPAMQALSAEEQALLTKFPNLKSDLNDLFAIIRDRSLNKETYKQLDAILTNSQKLDISSFQALKEVLRNTDKDALANVLKSIIVLSKQPTLQKLDSDLIKSASGFFEIIYLKEKKGFKLYTDFSAEDIISKPPFTAKRFELMKKLVQSDKYDSRLSLLSDDLTSLWDDLKTDADLEKAEFLYLRLGSFALYALRAFNTAVNQKLISDDKDSLIKTASAILACIQKNGDDATFAALGIFSSSSDKQTVWLDFFRAAELAVPILAISPQSREPLQYLIGNSNFDINLLPYLVNNNYITYLPDSISALNQLLGKKDFKSTDLTSDFVLDVLHTISSFQKTNRHKNINFDTMIDSPNFNRSTLYALKDLFALSEIRQDPKLRIQALTFFASLVKEQTSPELVVKLTTQFIKTAGSDLGVCLELMVAMGAKQINEPIMIQIFDSIKKIAALTISEGADRFSTKGTHAYHMKVLLLAALQSNRTDLLKEASLARIYDFFTTLSKTNPPELVFDLLNEIIRNRNSIGTYKEIFSDETAGALVLLLQNLNRIKDKEIKEKAISAAKEFLTSSKFTRSNLTWINSIMAQSPADSALPLLWIAKTADGELQKDFIVKILRESKDVKEGYYHFYSILSNTSTDELNLALRTYERGRKIAGRLLGSSIKEKLSSYKDPIMSLNFAYALSVMAEDIVVDMHKQFGIRYFLRYSKELLLASYETWQYKTDKPIVSIHACYKDWNGAFYYDKKHLDGFLKGYAPIISEGATDYALYDSIKFMSRSNRYTEEPIGKPAVSVLMGHGSPKDILFGSDTKEGNLDLNDEKDLMKLRKDFAPGFKVVLVSCSTGKDGNAIGAMIARAWKARLFAPTEPANVSRFVFDPTTNLLIDVKYYGKGREFDLSGIPMRLID